MHVVVVPEQVEHEESQGSHSYTPPSWLSRNPSWHSQDPLSTPEFKGQLHDPDTMFALDTAQAVQVVEVPEHVRQLLSH